MCVPSGVFSSCILPPLGGLEFFFNRGFNGVGYLASLIAKCRDVGDFGVRE
jgi:hypothetical protein